MRPFLALVFATLLTTSASANCTTYTVCENGQCRPVTVCR